MLDKNDLSIPPPRERPIRDRLLRIGGTSENWRLIRAMITVGLLTMFVAASGALRDMFVAARFGISGDLDAFLIAFVLPSFAISVIAGSLSASFIPTFVRVRDQAGSEAAQRLFSSTVFLSAGILTAASAVLGVIGYSAMPLLASGFNPSQLALSRILFVILVPLLVIKGLATLWAAGLNATNRFALPASTPALVPVAVIILMLFAAPFGVYALAGGVAVGYAIEGAVLAAGLRREGFSLMPRWHGLTPELRNVMRQYAPMSAGALLMSSTLLVDQSMAAALPPGSVATLHFGSKLVMLVLSVAYVALGTALLPHYSRLVAARDWGGIRATVRLYGGLIIACSVPILLFLALYGELLIGLLFQRGEFSAADRAHAARVQLFFALQIPFYLLGTLLVRLISSLNANHILMWGAAINLPVNILLNYLFMRRWGVAGIALSTSIVYLVSCCFLGAMLMRHTRGWTALDGELMKSP